jgi:hypothetical protein
MTQRKEKGRKRGEVGEVGIYTNIYYILTLFRLITS